MNTNLRDLRGMSEADRREGGVFRLGRIEACDYGRALVRVRLDPELLTAWLPWTTWAAGRLRVWSPPVEGEQCMVLSPSGEPHLAVAMPALWCGAYPPPSNHPEHVLLQFDDGAYIRHEMDTNKMHLYAPKCVWIDTNLVVDGTLTAAGDVLAGGGEISLRNHVHPGVSPGGSVTAPGIVGGAPPCSD